MKKGIDYQPRGEFQFWLPLLNRKEISGIFLIGFQTKYHNYEFEPSFGTRYQLLEHSRIHFSYSTFYEGIMLIMIFYHTIIALILWDKTYALYSLCLVGVFLTISYGLNFPMVTLLIEETIAHDYFTLWISVVFIFMQLFTTSYFNLKEFTPNWHKTLIIFNSIVVLNGFMLFIIPAYIVNIIGALFILIFYILSIFIGINQIKKKHPLARLYVLAWGSFI